RVAHAIEGSREDIAAKCVGAKQMRGARWLEAHSREHCWFIGCPKRHRKANDDPRANNDTTEQDRHGGPLRQCEMNPAVRDVAHCADLAPILTRGSTSA